MEEIHYAAARGDLETVVAELKKDVDVNLQNPLNLSHVDFPEDALDDETIKSLKSLNQLVESYGNGLDKTPLICAAENKNNNLEVIKFLIDSGAKVNAKGGSIETCALAQAIRFGPVAKVKFLIDSGADINYKCLTESGAWFDIAYNFTEFQEDIANLLLGRGLDYQTRAETFKCIFSQLISRGQFKILKKILDDGGDRELLKWSELMWQIVYGTLDDVRELFTNRNYSLSDTDSNGRTAWLLCALNGDVNKAKLLLKHGAKIHACGPTGESALHAAMKNDHVQMVRWLLSIGLDIEQIEICNSTPLIIAAEQNAVNSMKVLLEAGANKRAVGDLYDNILNAASAIEVIEVLVKEGFDLNFIASDGYTLLKSAAEDNNKKLVDGLLKLGTNTETTSTGDTALHKAICFDYLDIAETLLKAGANSNAQDVDGWSPLHYCESKKSIDLLLKFGADKALVNIIGERADQSLRNDLRIYLKKLTP